MIKRIVMPCITIFGLGVIIGMGIASKNLEKRLKWYYKELQRAWRRERLYDTWMVARKYGMPMDKFLVEKGINSAAIYGMTQIGEAIYLELKDTPIEVLYAIDRNPKWAFPDLPVYSLRDAPEKRVDAVIVATFMSFDTVKKTLLEKGYQNILSIDELLLKLLEK